MGSNYTPTKQHNFEELKEDFEGIESILVQTFYKFKDRYKEMIQEIIQFDQDQDNDALQRAAHSFKSNLAIFKLDDAAEFARQIEHSLASGQKPNNCSEIIASLEASSQILMQELELFIEKIAKEKDVA